MLSITKAVDHRWFDGYDWVIRLNPDVLIVNDTWILEQMRNETCDGVFGNCNDSPSIHVNSDFTMFRPRALTVDALRTNHPTAEHQMTATFKDTVGTGRFSILKGIGLQGGTCRVRGHSSPVVHQHDTEIICRNTYDNSKFVHGWEWADLKIA